MTHRKEEFPAIHFQGYGYRYPDASIYQLKDLTLAIDAHTTTALMGDSGSGKSTLINAATGFIPQFYRGGQVDGLCHLNGQDTTQTDIFKMSRNYAAVFQNFGGQLLAADVSSAVAFSLENQGLPLDQIRQRVASALDTVGINHLATREVSTLSGGERQLAAIASGLVKNTPVFILDDATSDLDVRAQRKVKDIIAKLQQQGTTVLLVDSTSPQWLLENSDQVVVLNNGRTSFIGRPADVTYSDNGFSQSEFRPGQNGPRAIRVENLSYTHQNSKTPALNGVSIDITKNSITGIIGANGSGKTTFSKIIAGIYTPQNGMVDLSGSKPHQLPARELVKKIAYVQQDAGNASLTDSVEHELAYPFKESQVSAEDIGLGGLEKEHPNNLPTGQKQMLAVGAALAHGAEVVICDEPTNGLNQAERRRLTDLMIRFQEQGTTFVLVSHDLGLIARASNNTIVLDQGKIVASGPTCEVISDSRLFNRINLPPLQINP